MNHLIALSIVGFGLFIGWKLGAFDKEDALVERVKDEIDCDSAVREAQNIINSKFINYGNSK